MRLNNVEITQHHMTQWFVPHSDALIIVLHDANKLKVLLKQMNTSC